MSLSTTSLVLYKCSCHALFPMGNLASTRPWTELMIATTSCNMGQVPSSLRWPLATKHRVTPGQRQLRYRDDTETTHPAMRLFACGYYTVSKPSPTHTVWQDTGYNMFLLIIIIDDFATCVCTRLRGSLVHVTSLFLLLPSPAPISQCQRDKTEHRAVVTFPVWISLSPGL